MAITDLYSNSKNITQRSLDRQVADALYALQVEREQDYQHGKFLHSAGYSRESCHTDYERQGWDVAATIAMAEWREAQVAVRDYADGERKFWKQEPRCACCNEDERNGYDAAAEDWKESDHADYAALAAYYDQVAFAGAGGVM
jgi:hypothetical protein